MAWKKHPGTVKSYRYSCTMALTDTQTSGHRAEMLGLQRRLLAMPAKIERARFCFAVLQFDFTTPDALAEVWYVSDAAARSEGRTCAFD